MKEYGYKQSNADHTLFLKQRNDRVTCLIIYVDDMIITGDDEEEMKQLKEKLFSKFEMKDLGNLKYFLGIEVLRSKHGIFICQKKYILDLLTETGLVDCKPVDTPMIVNHKLHMEPNGKLADKERYQRLVGKLIYLSHTRPDIAYAVGVVSQFMHQPQVNHMEAVRIALRRIGVQLLELDRESGNVTISTSENPEVIRYALERQLKKSVVILSRDLVPANQNPNPVVSHQVPANQTLDLQELGQVVLRLAQVLDGVEIMSSNTIRINFIHRESPLVVRPESRGNSGVQIVDADADDVEDAPPRSPLQTPPRATTEPSAPLMPVAEHSVYGYPPGFYGVSRTRSHDDPNGCCTIMYGGGGHNIWSARLNVQTDDGVSVYHTSVFSLRNPNYALLVIIVASGLQVVLSLQSQTRKQVVFLFYLLKQVENPVAIMDVVLLDVVLLESKEDLQAFGQVVLRLARDLDGVEITNSNTTRVNFIQRQTSLPCGNIGVQIIDADVEYAPPRPPPRSPPWVPTEPSAPPMPNAEQAVNGYPPDFYGVSRTRSHDYQNGWCTIM
ncbi:hypothetical protein L1987_25010 [Smallanthus sonchifolius]|uniref:Uncharacterized protein n=1 Tax=Smallanthus sonchifolius TaxID=185202 RepID=A0ACB9IND8_9ASTR|nr:hypothetical protein L1987_25010 [Smallanthus sonchifolius]